MVQFKQHIVRYGETIQSIAQDELGDMTQWIALAQFNSLRHPYIVDTVAEKLNNPDHLVTIGDTLLIKLDNSATSNLISNLSTATSYDQEEIMALALGKDLDILPLPKNIGSPGYDAQVFEMKSDGKGAIATKRGIENLKQSLYIRIITPQGSYVGHPEYGSKVDMYLGLKNTEENASLIDIEIERTMRTDSRVKNVVCNGHTVSGNTYSSVFTVTSYSLNEAFQMVMSSINNGPIVLTDNFTPTNPNLS
jgi:phage baseplate assembly protein W